MNAPGTSIPSWGTRHHRLCFHGRLFAVDFLLAGMSFPITGLLFLSAHKLCSDAAYRFRYICRSAPTWPSLQLYSSLRFLWIGLRLLKIGVWGTPPPRRVAFELLFVGGDRGLYQGGREGAAAVAEVPHHHRCT